ncbi:hypothetical protein [Promicromonospora sp. NPDC023987]|uniref:hypothetical protein n=1 Tax=Promicromonospora sp. NPDC023987 TaxID=3155360 RepID=UPI0033DF6AC6
MPNDADKSALSDGAQAVQALQALVESTRQLDPVDSYYAIRDLLACARHLSQAAQHIAMAHRDNAAHAIAVGDLIPDEHRFDGYGLAGAVGAQLDGTRQHLDQARTTLQHAADRSVHIDWITPSRPAAAEPRVAEPPRATGHELPQDAAAPGSSARGHQRGRSL